MRSESGPRRASPAIGNDIVDLGDPRCRRRDEDDRFLRRVFASEERSWIAGSADPERAVWLGWAAKEAAYKVVSKLLGAPPPFEHRAFVVHESEQGAGHVSFDELRVPFRNDEEPNSESIHVVAFADPLGDSLALSKTLLPDGAAPRDRFTDREYRAVYSPASAWVRLLAREHLERLLLPQRPTLEIVCVEGQRGRTPPSVLIEGSPSEWDVSLSHHGRFVAWALARAEPIGRV